MTTTDFYLTKNYQVMIHDRNKDIPANERWFNCPNSFSTLEVAEAWIFETLVKHPKDGPNAPLMWVRTYYKLSQI